MKALKSRKVVGVYRIQQRIAKIREGRPCTSKFKILIYFCTRESFQKVMATRKFSIIFMATRKFSIIKSAHEKVFKNSFSKFRLQVYLFYPADRKGEAQWQIHNRLNFDDHVLCMQVLWWKKLSHALEVACFERMLFMHLWKNFCKRKMIKHIIWK